MVLEWREDAPLVIEQGMFRNSYALDFVAGCWKVPLVSCVCVHVCV